MMPPSPPAPSRHGANRPRLPSPHTLLLALLALAPFTTCSASATAVTTPLPRALQESVSASPSRRPASASRTARPPLLLKLSTFPNSDTLGCAIAGTTTNLSVCTPFQWAGGPTRYHTIIDCDERSNTVWMRYFADPESCASGVGAVTYSPTMSCMDGRFTGMTPDGSATRMWCYTVSHSPSPSPASASPSSSASASGSPSPSRSGSASPSRSASASSSRSASASGSRSVSSSSSSSGSATASPSVTPSGSPAVPSPPPTGTASPSGTPPPSRRWGRLSLYPRRDETCRGAPAGVSTVMGAQCVRVDPWGGGGGAGWKQGTHWELVKCGRDVGLVRLFPGRCDAGGGRRVAIPRGCVRGGRHGGDGADRPRPSSSSAGSVLFECGRRRGGAEGGSDDGEDAGPDDDVEVGGWPGGNATLPNVTHGGEDYEALSFEEWVALESASSPPPPPLQGGTAVGSALGAAAAAAVVVAVVALVRARREGKGGVVGGGLTAAAAPPAGEEWGVGGGGGGATTTVASRNPLRG